MVSDQTLFIGMIFIVGFLMSQAFVSPLMGSGRKARRRLRERIRELSSDQSVAVQAVLIREDYGQLSPLSRLLMGLPGMEALQSLIVQAGSSRQPHQLILLAIASSAVATIAGFMLFGWGGSLLLLGLLGFALPFMRLRSQRAKRLALIEEQLPDTLTVMARAMRMGRSFGDAMNLVSQEMPAPISDEFGTVFNQMNSSLDTRSALMGLLARVPSIAVMAMITSVLITRETGGNQAEVLDKLASVVRERFRFQRSIRTLSSEGRATAWVLVLLPFAMTAVLAWMNPEWMAQLTEDPAGRPFIYGGFLLMLFGIFWIRKIVRIDA